MQFWHIGLGPFPGAGNKALHLSLSLATTAAAHHDDSLISSRPLAAVLLSSEAMKALRGTQQAVEPNRVATVVAHSSEWPLFSFPVSVIVPFLYGMRGLASSPAPNLEGQGSSVMVFFS